MAVRKTAEDDPKRALMRSIEARHPGFAHAVREDARVTASYRGERKEFRSTLDTLGQVLRLCWMSDAFFAQVCYRLKAALQAKRVPVLPRIVNRLAMIVSQVTIGDPVVIQPGLYIIHGQVVIDGLVEIDTGVVIAPWVTIGLRAGDYRGATIESHVQIGTGAKIIGSVRIGTAAEIGANSVVVRDVAPGDTVTGAPARSTRR